MRDAAFHIAAQQDGFAPSLAERAFAGLLAAWNAVLRYRRARATLAMLDGLDDHMLGDIGLTRADLEAQTGRGPVGGPGQLAEIARQRREERWR